MESWIASTSVLIIFFLAFSIFISTSPLAVMLPMQSAMKKINKINKYICQISRYVCHEINTFATCAPMDSKYIVSISVYSIYKLSKVCIVPKACKFVVNEKTNLRKEVACGVSIFNLSQMQFIDKATKKWMIACNTHGLFWSRNILTIISNLPNLKFQNISVL